MDNNKGLNISAKSFVLAIIIIFLLMAVTYALTFIIPGGEYARIIDDKGNSVLDTESGYQTLEAGIPFWKWILSPILVLGAEGSGALIAVIVFLLVIGGVFNALNECGLMNYMLKTLVEKYGNVRYRLMAVLIFFFMAMGSLVGSFEEIVPFVPIIVSLAIGLGWDAVTGIAILFWRLDVGSPPEWLILLQSELLRQLLVCQCSVVSGFAWFPSLAFMCFYFCSCIYMLEQWGTSPKIIFPG